MRGSTCIMFGQSCVRIFRKSHILPVGEANALEQVDVFQKALLRNSSFVRICFGGRQPFDSFHSLRVTNLLGKNQ